MVEGAWNEFAMCNVDCVFGLRRMHVRLEERDPSALFASKLCAIERAESRGLTRDIVTRCRHHALPPRELQLEHHHCLFAECHLRSCQIEFPHACEARIVKALDRIAMSDELFTPRLERLRVMQAQNFDIGDKQARALYRR